MTDTTLGFATEEEELAWIDAQCAEWEAEQAALAAERAAYEDDQLWKKELAQMNADDDARRRQMLEKISR